MAVMSTEEFVRKVLDGEHPVVRPMKPTDTPLTQVNRLVKDSQWVFEQKMDGTRALVTCWRDPASGEYLFDWLTTGGTPLKFAAAKQHLTTIEKELTTILSRSDCMVAVLDGELMIEDGQYRVFDLVVMVHNTDGVWVGPEKMYWNRRKWLETLLGMSNEWYPDYFEYQSPVVMVPMATNGLDKDLLWRLVVEQGVEGVVAKDLYAPYEPGTRTTSQLKLKLVKTVECAVVGHNRGRNEAGRETGSATLSLLDQSTGENLVVGAASLIGKEKIEAGDVVEVNYLYWTGSALVQPRIVRRRTDKRPEECTLDQLPSYSRKLVR